MSVLPTDLHIGREVYYHADMDAPHDDVVRRVETEVFEYAGRDLVSITGKKWVALEALTLKEVEQ